MSWFFGLKKLANSFILFGIIIIEFLKEVIKFNYKISKPYNIIIKNCNISGSLISYMHFVSLLMVTMSQPSFLKWSWWSASASNSVAQTNVKSAG